MSASIKTKIGVLCSIFISCLLLMSSILHWGIADVTETFRDTVQMSGKIIRQTQLLKQLIIDAETGQRGYIITGKTGFLQPYNKANERFKKVIKDLRGKLQDKPQYLGALEEIEHLKWKWEGMAGEPEILLRKLVGESKI